MNPNDPAFRGQADYTPWMLAVYDPWVLGFMARAVWRCPTPPVVERYRRYVGGRHLDVGPGTGYFLDKADLPPEAEITLLDPNPHVLAHASRRLAPGNVTTVEADVLKPLPVEGPFDSAALNYLLHCLPGPMSRKAAAIRNIAKVLTPEGVPSAGPSWEDPPNTHPKPEHCSGRSTGEAPSTILTTLNKSYARSSKSRFRALRSKSSVRSPTSRPTASDDPAARIPPPDSLRKAQAGHIPPFLESGLPPI